MSSLEDVRTRCGRRVHGLETLWTRQKVRVHGGIALYTIKNVPYDVEKWRARLENVAYAFEDDAYAR
jgi:hypothetical protein